MKSMLTSLEEDDKNLQVEIISLRSALDSASVSAIELHIVLKMTKGAVVVAQQRAKSSPTTKNLATTVELARNALAAEVSGQKKIYTTFLMTFNRHCWIWWSCSQEIDWKRFDACICQTFTLQTSNQFEKNPLLFQLNVFCFVAFECFY